MEKKTFCHFCGHPLIRKFLEGRQRLYCQRCVRPIYENPVPATCLLVIDGHRRILLVKRSVEPRKGFWCLPGGFLELDETPEEGALRELAEETGLTGEIASLLGLAATPSEQYQAIVMIGFLVTRFQGTPHPGDDAEEVAWFDHHHLPMIAFDSHAKFISDYFG